MKKYKKGAYKMFLTNESTDNRSDIETLCISLGRVYTAYIYILMKRATKVEMRVEAFLGVNTA